MFGQSIAAMVHVKAEPVLAISRFAHEQARYSAPPCRNRMKMPEFIHELVCLAL
jgi:hypothetical protein